MALELSKCYIVPSLGKIQLGDGIGAEWISDKDFDSLKLQGMNGDESRQNSEEEKHLAHHRRCLTNSAE